MRRCAVVLLALLACEPAFAQRPVLISGNARCPTPALVAEVLQPMLAAHRVLLSAPASERIIAVDVWQEDGRFGVRIGPAQRALSESTSACEDRARAVALVVALSLEPPSVLLPAAKPPPRAPRATWRAALEMGGLFLAAPGVERRSDMLSAGGLLRAVAGSAHVQGTLSVGGLTPTTLDLGEARARVLRVPLDAGVRAGGGWGTVELFGELGLAATILSIDGEGLSPSRGGTRIDLGLRVGALATFWIRPRWGLVAAVQATFAPSPITLEATPGGAIGATPRVHIGGLLGAAVRLH